MRQRIPLGGQSADLNSRLSRQELINGYIESNNDGSFKRLQRTPGLKSKLSVGSGPIRGLFSSRKFLFVASGSEVYQVSSTFVVTKIGDITNSKTQVKFNAIGTDIPQVMVLDNNQGWVIQGDLFTKVFDVDFTPDVSVASLNQRFWFNKPESNEFFASKIGDGLDYDSLTFASAEQNPDNLVYVVAKKTGLWLMGTNTIEPWQTVLADFPVRPITGGTIQRGVGAKLSVTEFEDDIFWLADDFTVRRISGSQFSKISDLSIERAIRGDGTISNPGYSEPQNAFGFFIDHPTHKVYCLTFPDDNVTWCYDVKTGLWHKRSSGGKEWRVQNSANFADVILMGDSSTNDVWLLDEGSYKQGDEIQVFQVSTPVVTDSDGGITISEIELVAEVGVGTIDNSVPTLGITKALPHEPLISVEYSRNGGKTWIARGSSSIGEIGDYEQRVIARRFGYIKRHGNFMIRFTVTENVPVVLYSLYADIEECL
jgi:hypothetical protein